MSLSIIAPEALEETVKHGKSLILFWTNWCPLCVPVIRYLEQLRLETPTALLIGLVDFDVPHPSFSTYSVLGTPTVVAFYEGEALFQWPGLRTEADYHDMVRVLSDYTP
ncbi:MAG: thioredoxin family protein [Lachnospiraceae bacterium]|jgi:thioredoxin-like negative regulator of GroEL|nr:thioredoxin family protein [Lachnospiraceae bacterium]